MHNVAPKVSKVAAILLVSFAAIACGSAADEGDGMTSGTSSESERLTIDASSKNGSLVAFAMVSGEKLSVVVKTSEDGKQRTLEIGAPGALGSLAKWTLAPEPFELKGELAGHGFGTFATRTTDMDRAFWDGVRASKEGEMLRAVARAGEGSLADPRLESMRDAISDVVKVGTVLEHIGLPIEGIDGDTKEPNASATEAGERLCSYASVADHTIKYVQYFTDYCRVGHHAATLRPSGGCYDSRCVQYVFSSGADASATYCHGGDGMNVDMDHLIGHGTVAGLWVHHTSYAGSNVWTYKEAGCW